MSPNISIGSSENDKSEKLEKYKTTIGNLKEDNKKLLEQVILMTYY